MRVGWQAVVPGFSLLLAALFALAPAPLQMGQERLFDVLLRLMPAPPAQVTVIDIGASDETGAPWDRAATARLAAHLAAAGPRALGFDMLFSGRCDARSTGDLAQALAGQGVVLGFLLAPEPGGVLPAPTLAVAQGATLWPAPGADAPCAALPGQAGAMALAADADGRLRRLPVGVALGPPGAGVGYPSLPVALAAQVTGGPVIAGPGWLRLGGHDFASEDGFLRFRPADAAAQAARRLRAEAVLAGAALPPGGVFLVGSSLPQAGGLRPTAAGPLTPSVQIAADLTDGLLAGHLPWRPVWANWAEAAAVLALGLAGAALMARAAPARAAAGALGLALGWGAAAGAATASGVLIDPLLPGLAAALLLLAALTGRAAHAARAERALRARMGQVLPPELVSRIAANPRLMRLQGEAREVTALFTDIEGFSAATARMGAAEMVARLDAYFTLTCAIVLRHGGMIDKLVGDSIHALFNAPLDQPGHEAAALACAAELIIATEAFCRQNNGFGRTRIGVECGPAVLGDVGFGGRIDYTAHGPAVNLAARLQEANKALGTQVCIGPGLGARLPGLRALGQHDIRSFGAIALFTLPE